jgi:hypothetical protein
MGQISQFLRKFDGGLLHYCPACRHAHGFWIDKPNPATKARWTWDGNILLPTFSPSMNIIARDPAGEIPTETCHYFLLAGVLDYLSDCTHGLRGINMQLPPLPDFLRD